MILNISKFIAEFCRQYEVSPPPLLRLGMDKKCLTTFNIRLTDGINTNDTNDINTSSNTAATSTPLNTTTLTNESLSSTNEDNYATIPIGTNLTLNLTKQEAYLYNYYRWLWIQFPWLAMPTFSDQLGELFSHNTSNTTKTHHDEILRASQLQEKLKVNLNKEGVIIQRSQSAKIITPNHTSSTSGGGGATQHLHPTTTSANTNTTSLLKDNIGSSNESLSTIIQQTSIYSDSNLPPEEIKRREIASRSWQAKKQDPSIGRVISASKSRTNALIKSRYTILPSPLSSLLSPLPPPLPHLLFHRLTLLIL